MGNIWIPGGGGGGESYDDLTLTQDKAPSGYTYVGADTNDEAGTGSASTVPEIIVPTNGRALIPKGYSDGTKYAINNQATMSGGTWTPQTYAQTIACAGKKMDSNIVINPFTDYSGYWNNSQTLFDNGNFGTLANGGLSSKGWTSLQTGTSTQGNTYKCMSYKPSVFAKSVNLAPYSKIRVYYFIPSKYEYDGSIWIRPISAGSQSNLSFGDSWASLGMFGNYRSSLASGTIITWNGDELVKDFDISGYSGQYWIGVNLTSSYEYVFRVQLIK